MKKITLIALVASCLAACDSRIDAVDMQMAEIRNQAPLPIEPTPVFEPAPQFNYAAHTLRMPFIASSLAEELKLMEGRRVYPNLTRPEQPLERYALEDLLMKGTMMGSSGRILALIHTPDREVERVQVGSYMGMNHGRVVNITPTRIDIVEIIPDGREGYVERPRSLILVGPTS